jgi:transcriptional regulator with XRE-family HTH domain
MKELVKTLTSEFSDKEYAHAYAEDFSNMSIAAQIKTLRNQRGWTQKELAEFTGMKQERVSALEDVNYEAWTAKTLQKLARSFDLTLKISFEKFSDRISDIDAISEVSLKRISREEDLLQFRENHFINHVETPMFYQADVVTKSTASNVVDIKDAGNYRASEFTWADDSDLTYLEAVSS